MKIGLRIASGAFLFTLLVGIISCGGGGGESGGGFDTNNENGDVKLAKETKVLNNSTMDGLSSVSEDSSTLTFDKNTSQLKNLIEGEVIILGESEATPYGALRKVSSIYESGDQTVVETTQATLEEAIENASIHISKSFSSVNAKAIQSLKGVTLRKYKAIDGKIYYELKNVKIAKGLEINGEIIIEPSFDFDMEISWFKLKELSFTNNTDINAKLTLSSSVNITTEKKVAIATVNLGAIPAGPIVIVPMLTVVVGFDGSVSAGLSSSVTQTATISGGVSYNNGIWSTDKDLASNFSYSYPSLSESKMEAKAYVGPELHLLIYGVTGPFTAIDGYLKLDADATEEPWFKLYGGVEGKLGVEIAIFSNQVVGYKMTLADYNKLLLQSVVAEITTPLASQTYLEGSPIQFEGNGIDANNDPLTDTSLVWASSIDGLIGTGTVVSTESLSVGTHTITLEATDTNFAMGTDTDTVTIIVQSETPTTAEITGPSDGSTYTEGYNVSFSGTGMDAEDGLLSGGSLVWTSSIDGQIGTGTNVSTSTLSEDTHTITLTATDSEGGTGTDTINVTVKPPPSENTPPYAEITAPSSGSTYTEGEDINFSGTGIDAEDGWLTGGSLIWKRLGSQIGTGTNFSTNSLPVGAHLISLTAIDSEGATGTDTISVTITVEVEEYCEVYPNYDGDASWMEHCYREGELYQQNTYFESGAIYGTVPYVNGVRNGTSTYYYESGAIRQTSPYVNDELNGTATFYYESGAIEYTVPCVNGVRHGTLIHYYESGAIHYTLPYVNGVPGSATYY